MCGTHLPRVRTFKQRLYKGAPLPTEVVALFDLARQCRKRSKLSTCALAREFWKCSGDDAKHTAVAMADSFLLRFRDTLMSNLQHEMRVDPHQVHAYLRHLHGAETTNCADPSAIPADPSGRPPLARFSSACKKLVTQTDSDPLPAAATSPQWLHFVHNVPDGDVIARPFTATELYPYFFPPSKRLRFRPCHAHCRICTQYLSEISQWRPRDPFPKMPAPHHRGGLHTSRGADIECLVAELIIWVRPEDWCDRFDYR